MEAKNRSDSVDSRSYSFDSTDSKIKIIIKKWLDFHGNLKKAMNVLKIV